MQPAMLQTNVHAWYWNMSILSQRDQIQCSKCCMAAGVTAATVTCLLLSIAVAFALSLRSRNNSDALLLTFSPLFLQAPATDGHLKKLKSFLIPWLLFAMLMSNIFTNFLQSVVVVPGKKLAEISFNDMVQQNFSFFSMNAGFIQAKHAADRMVADRLKSENATNGRDGLEFLRQERVLAERVQPESRDFNELVKRLLTERKMALVELTMTRATIAEVVNAVGHDLMEGKEAFYPLTFQTVQC